MSGRYRVRRDRVLFVDVEMTCWDGAAPPGEEAEVIEFGIAELDAEALEVTRSASILVRPERSSVSAFCESLTGLEAGRLRREGRPLREAVRTLAREWGTGSKAWMSWGADRRAIVADCAAKGAEDPFSASWHDLGMQFTLLAGARSAVGLPEACGMLGVDGAWERHSGEADARQTALAWAAMARLVRAAAGSSGEGAG